MPDIFNVPDDDRSKSGGPRTVPLTPPGVPGFSPSPNMGRPGTTNAGQTALTPEAQPTAVPGGPSLTPPPAGGLRRSYSEWGIPGAVGHIAGQAVDNLKTGANVVESLRAAAGRAVAPTLIGSKGAEAVGLGPLPQPPAYGDFFNNYDPNGPPVAGGEFFDQPDEMIPGGGGGPAQPPMTATGAPMGPALPEGVTPQTMPDGTVIHGRLTQPEEINQLGLAQYSGTAHGATAAGINGPAPVHATPGGNITFGQTTTAPGEAEKKQGPAKKGFAPGSGQKPLTQPNTTKIKGGKKAPEVKEMDPFIKRLNVREMRMELGDLADDMKRGRLSAKQAAVLMPLIKMKYAKLFGLDPGDAAKADSRNFQTGETAAAAHNETAARTEREAMRQAGALSVSKEKGSPLAKPFEAVTLTDEDFKGNKTQRIEAFDPNLGSVKPKDVNQRWFAPTHDDFYWVGPEGGDRNDQANWAKK